MFGKHKANEKKLLYKISKHRSISLTAFSKNNLLFISSNNIFNSEIFNVFNA